MGHGFRQVAAIDDIGLAALAGIEGTDDQIVKAVAIDVAAAGDRHAGEERMAGAGNPESLFRYESTEIDISNSAGLPVDQVGFASIGPAAGLGPVGGDDQVVDAVAVDVARHVHRVAGAVAVRAADDPEALRGRDRGDVDIARPALFAVDDIGAAGYAAARDKLGGSDDQIGNT